MEKNNQLIWERYSRLREDDPRMTPLKTIDIVRLELCGALLSTRLRATLEKELNLTFRKVMHLVDSEIVKAMIHKESFGFNTFASNRIGEIQQTTCKREWYWIPGKLWVKVADITTRGCVLSELEAKLWQEGPDFLKLPEEEWPSKGNLRNDIQFEGALIAENSQDEESLLDRFELGRISRWKLLIHTTARVCNLYARFKMDRARQPEPSVASLEKAKLEWVKVAQRQLNLKEIKN